MFKKVTIIAAISLMASLFFSSPVFADTRNMEGWGDEPVICTPVCDFSKSIVALDTLEDKFPGHFVTMPLSVEIDEEKEITEMVFNLNAESGITFDNVVSSGEWNGSMTVVNDDSELYIRFHGNPTGQTFEDLTKLADIDIEIATDRAFGTSYSITHDANFPDIRTTEDDHCVFQTRNTGLVKLSGGQVSLWIEDTVAYSYQGHDIDPVTGDPDKYILIEMPVYFNSEFPVDSFVIELDVNDLLVINDTIKFEPNPSYSAAFTGFSSYRYLTDNRDGMDPYPENNDIWLGTLKARGQDYESDYGTVSFDTTNYVVITGNPVEDDIFYCDSTSLQKSAQKDSIFYTNGEAVYPVYRCSTFVDSGIVDAYLKAEVPIRVDHTFWAQKYTYWIEFHKDSLTLVDPYVTVPTGFPTVQKIDRDTSNNYQRYEIATSGNLTGLNIPANSNDTIFTLHFEVSDDFSYATGTKAAVLFNTTDDLSSNKVWDYFHPSGNKIDREYDDGSSYFNLSDGEVKVQALFATSIDTVGCKKADLSIPVNVYRVTNNIWDSLSFKILCPNTTYYKISKFSIGGAAYSYDEVYQTTAGDGSWITVDLKFSSSEIDDEGKLGELLMEYVSSAHLPVPLNWDYCFFKMSQGGGQLNANPQINGVIACGMSKPSVLQLPDGFSISQNYPNPFNARTKIAFNLAYDAYVNITIYDIMGRQTRRLIDNVYQAGKHIVEWDGKDNTGNTVASGFYFYRFEADEYATVKKMLMLK